MFSNSVLLERIPQKYLKSDQKCCLKDSLLDRKLPRSLTEVVLLFFILQQFRERQEGNATQMCNRGNQLTSTAKQCMLIPAHFHNQEESGGTQRERKTRP